MAEDERGAPPAVPPEPLPEGYRIGDFIIQGEVARTRLGRVYKASRVHWQQVVAVYVLSPALREKEWAHFLHLARRAHEKGERRPRNPLLDIFEIDGLTGVVLEFSEAAGPVLDVMEES